MKIKLTEKDISEAAKGAYYTYRKYKNWGQDSKMESFYVGNLGEAAYCRMIGKDYLFERYTNGDGGVDVNDVQIKTRTWTGRNAMLIVNIDKDASILNPKVKKIVLMVFDPDKHEIRAVGEVSKENFMKKSKYNPTFKANTLDERDLDLIYQEQT